MNPFASKVEAQVGALGETILIQRIQEWLGPSSPEAPKGIGDDCAAIPLPTDRTKLLTTTDPIVYLKHFDNSVAPEQAAAKLLKRNISDIAAMGGEPKHAVISFAFPANLSIDWLQAFYRSLSTEANAYGVEINGGDICETSGFLGAFLTLIGFSGDRVLQRNQTQTGARIYVTGTLGGSISGKHIAFKPRLEEGQWLAKRPETISCMDLSDGLGKDCSSLLSSKQIAIINSKRLPISRAAIELSKSSGRTPIDHAMNDGEDYELLFAIAEPLTPAEFESDWSQRFDTPLTCIGQVAESEETDESIFLTDDSSKIDITGYAHFGNA
ncbi:MAG: thiamine-phosphate kinase [Opitutaceae bacterium]|nr:thiamine-phosphate kinase [Opitutaceae bacterium]